MFFNDFINNRRKELNISIDELVIKSGIPKGTLSKITAGISTNPTLSTVEALCSALNCSLDDAVGYIERNKNNLTFSKSEIDVIKKYRTLDEYGKKAIDDLLATECERCQNENKIEVLRLPMSELKASAGTGNWLEANMYGTIEVADTPESRKADLVIEISGNSMEPTYHNGDNVLVRLQPGVNIGEVGIFIKDTEGYIKELGKNRLISHNKEYPDIKLNEFTDIRCVGKVVGIAQII